MSSSAISAPAEEEGKEVNPGRVQEHVGRNESVAAEESSLGAVGREENAASVHNADQFEESNYESESTIRVDTDGDSAVGIDDEVVSSTASLRSSLYEGVIENGRTYHKYKEGKYVLPNDEAEQNRLDMQNHLCKLTMHGKSHLAPIKKNLNNVLDFGTGTGIWAIEFAQEYPSANVLGTDLSPIQPLYVPPNCRFEVDDFEDDWLYTQKFDYIHGRLLCVAFRDPATTFRKAFHSLEPNGFLEMFDGHGVFQSVDDTLQGTALQKFSQMMVEGCSRFGKSLVHTPKYKSYMEDAGFVDVVEKKYYWPFNTWPKGKYHKTLGLWYNQDMHEGLSGMAMATFTRGLDMSPEAVELFLVDVRKDLDNKNIHAYLPIYVVYGRKPA